MKRTTILVLATILLLSATAFGDGIPVTEDKKAVRGEYTRVTLNHKQILDVETRRTVTLRPDQKAELEEIAGGPLGDITVYSSRYNECTCFAINVMAIWTRKGFLDFPHSWLVTEQELKERRDRGEGNLAEEPSQDTEYRFFIVVFDSYGEMFVNGKHHTLNQIKTRIDALRRVRPKNGTKKAVQWSVIFDPPPPINEKTDKKVADNFHEIVKHCKKRNIEILDWGVESKRF